jgi:hypothetical protein
MGGGEAWLLEEASRSSSDALLLHLHDQLEWLAQVPLEAALVAGEGQEAAEEAPWLGQQHAVQQAQQHSQHAQRGEGQAAALGARQASSFSAGPDMGGLNADMDGLGTSAGLWASGSRPLGRRSATASPEPAGRVPSRGLSDQPMLAGEVLLQPLAQVSRSPE